MRALIGAQAPRIVESGPRTRPTPGSREAAPMRFKANSSHVLAIIGLIGIVGCASERTGRSDVQPAPTPGPSAPAEHAQGQAPPPAHAPDGPATPAPNAPGGDQHAQAPRALDPPGPGQGGGANNGAN